MIRVVLFIFMIGIVMQWPVTQHLIVNMACQRLDYSDDVCSDLSSHPDAEDVVQAEASRIMIWHSVFCDVPGAIASLILGAQSDKVGRKRIMLLPILGVTFLNAILLVGSLMHSASMLFLLSSSVVLGASGGIGTFVTAVTNYITDNTPEDQRTESLSKTLPFMGLGMIVGLLFSGILAQHLGVSAVYFIELVILLFVVYLVICHLKESCPCVVEPSTSSEKGSGSQQLGVLASVWDNLTAGVRVFTSQKSSNVKTQLLILVLSGMICVAAVTAEGNLLLLYTKKSPFSWSPSMYSGFAALKNALGIVGQVVGTAVFFKVMGERSIRNDFILLQMATLSACLMAIIIAAASSTYVLMASSLIVMFATPAQSANGSITSRLVNPSQKGAFMSLGTFLNTLAVPIVGFILNSIYSASVQTSPSFVFFCMASMHAAVLAAITYVVMFTLDRGVTDEKKGD